MASLNERLAYAFSRSGDHVEGRLLTEDDFIDAVNDVIGAVADMNIVIDAMGRIYIDGIHVGWVKRDAGLVELKALAAAVHCELPSLDSMLKLEEVFS